MSEGTVPWILVLGRCVPGLCLKLVCGCSSGSAGVAGSGGTCRCGGIFRREPGWLRGRVHWRGRDGGWGYINLVGDGDSPFCVRPVTGSHLFRAPT